MTNYKLSEGSSVLFDLIRGISAQLVVVGHGFYIFHICDYLRYPYSPGMQNVAVLIFFLLSGYLISYSTIRKIRSNKLYSIKHYLADRFSRIYTAFIPALIVVVMIDLISISIDSEAYRFSQSYNIKSFFGNLLMLQDYPVPKLINEYSITNFGSARTFWSLAVEWWIYLFFGFLLLVVRKSKLKFSNLILLGFLAIVPCYNLVGGRGDGLTVFWIFGVVAYFLNAYKVLANVKIGLRLILFFSLIVAALYRVYSTMDEYEAVFAFLLALLLAVSVDLFKEIKFSKGFKSVIRFGSGYSYTLYLVHFSVLDLISSHFTSDSNSPYLLFLLGFIISNLISAILGYCSELVLTRKVKVKIYSWIEPKAKI